MDDNARLPGASFVDVKKDGVIDYPLFHGMRLDGVWSVTPSLTGPGVAPADGFLHYSVTGQTGWNQWAYVSISTALPGQGSVLTYQVRANVIQGSEVKFTVADNVILRFTDGGQTVNWQWFDSNGKFETLAPSSIRADGVWHTVTMVFSLTSVSLLEDGEYLFTWGMAARDEVLPVFHMQVLDTGVSMSFDLGEIYSVPPTYADGVSTPWDYAFTANTVPPAAAVATVSTQGGPEVSYGDGYARFAATPLVMNDTTASLTVQQAAPAVSVQLYRLRINEAGGVETTVAFPGGQILRYYGGELNWQFFTPPGTWRTLAASSVVVGAAEYTVIALATSGSSVTVFENGMFRYRLSLPAPVSQWQPAVTVQHRTAGTNVSIDLGGIRTLPAIKTLDLLAGDLRDETLAFFPLIGSFSNALGNSADLLPVPAGGQVPFTESPFGVSADFAGGGTALSIPPLAAATASSYTITAWAKVNSYPPAGQVTGIAGSLLLDSTGHLVFRFLFNGGAMYQERRYVSDHVFPLGDWHNVIVTYSYEESRLGIFLDGRLCCLEYMGGDLTTASTSVPSAFFVGGDQASADSPLVVLDGSVGVVMILTQHIHQQTVPVFTSKPVVSPAGLPARQEQSDLEQEAFFVFLSIGWIVLAAVVVVVAVAVQNYYANRDKTTKDTYPELDKLVAAIRDKAGAPAAPGVRVSRADIGSPHDQKIHLDVGGEGRTDVGGLVAGFSAAINVTGVAKSTDPRPPRVTGPGRLTGQAIPHLVELPARDTNPGLPFSDGFADAISMIAMELTSRDVEEIARVIRDGGTIDLWVQEKYLPAIRDLASRLGSVVEEPGEIPDFRGNGKPDDKTWFKRRTIIAHKTGAGNQPYAPVWYPDGLLAWDPGKDPNAIFNRSTVPLANRAWNESLRANAGAQAGPADIMALASFAPTAGNPSQGAVDSAGYYAFGYWQYIGALVFWGGSAGEGIILAPNPTAIDAAHRNGVPVFGNVFFPPAEYGGKLDWVRQFTDRGMPAKLVQAAQYFGFDGWFVNQETRGGDAALAAAVRDTIVQARRLAPDLRFIWYDAMASNGQVGWQGALNASNAMFFQSGSTRVSDSLFIDFRWAWTPGSLTSSASYAAQLGRSGFDLYAGVDVEPTGYDNNGLAQIFPASGSRTVSAGLHRTDWTYSSTSSTRDFYARESTFWAGPAGDPSKATTTATWRAPASIVAERTPVTAKPFVTSFNTGQGNLYAVDGVRLSSVPWNNLGLQDVLPTYRWMVSGPSGTSLAPKLDFDDAYNGGTSLLLKGSVPGPVLVRLYQTRLPVTSPTQVLVTFRAVAAGPTFLQVAATFADSTDPVCYDVGTAASAGWQTVPISLGSRQGQTLVRLDLRIVPPSPVSAYQIRIGQLAVTDGPVNPPAPPPVTLAGAARISPARQTLRLSWSGGAPGPVHHYNVYRRNPGNDRTYLGGTSNVAYFVPRLDRVGSETATIIDVEAVSTTFARSGPSSVTVRW